MLDDNLRKSDVPKAPRWKLARERADEFTKPYDRPPIPVHQIAENNGVDVVFADFGRHARTVAGFCDFAAAKLYVNRSDRIDRQGFTIAHEFGHWVLHRELFLSEPSRYPVLPRFSVPNRNDPLEKEANHFAAHLLVPSRLLAKVAKATVPELARAFGVSEMMMGFRLEYERPPHR